MCRTSRCVYLFIGEAEHEKEKVLASFKRSLLGQETAELNYHVFYGNESGVKEIVDCATTLPFFNRKRLVVVKRAERLSEADKKLLSDYVVHPQNTTCLVLLARDDSLLRELLPSPHSVETIRFDRIPAFKLSGWIREALRAKGKSIDAESVELLKELFGHSEQGILERELEKLAVSVGTRAAIRLKDVEEIAGKGLVGSTFDLTDAIGRRDTERALLILHGLLNVTPPRYGEIVGLISWHLKTLLKGRILLEKARGEHVITGSLKIPKRLWADFMEQVRRVKVEELASRLEALLRTDFDIKLGRTDPKTALEALVVRLCLR